MRIVAANEPSPFKIVGGVVKTLRGLRGWSQADLAAYARKHSKERISAKTVTNIEKGTHKPTIGKLLALADAFEIDVWQLFIPLPEGLDEKGAEKYLRSQTTLARYFRNTLEPGRDGILRTARLEQQAKLSDAV